jgi:hypothetical protein
MPDTPEYVLPEPTTAELDLLVQQLAMIDPNGEGVPMSRLRVFYPKLGWGHLQKRLEALQAAGRITRATRSTGGPVPFEFWSRVEG